MDSKTSNLMEDYVRGLERRLAESRKQADELRAEIERTNENWSNSERMLFQQHQETKRLRAKLDRAWKAHEACESENMELRAERDDARRTAEYWKAEHIAGNTELALIKKQSQEVIEALHKEAIGFRAERDEARQEVKTLREQSFEEAKDEMIFHKDGPAEPEDPISQAHLDAICAQFPQHADKLRDYARSWNAEERITQEMLDSVEMPDDTPEMVNKSFAKAMRVLDFYAKLQKIEAERDALKKRLRYCYQENYVSGLVGVGAKLMTIDQWQAAIDADYARAIDAAIERG